MPRAIWKGAITFGLVPVGKGEKVYALLREAMIEAGVIGIARGVMHTKAHLAALLLLASRFGRPTLGCDQLRIQG